MTITELRNKRAKTWEAAKAFLDSHRNADGFLSAEDDTTYTNMENEITALGIEISRLERLEAMDREMSMPTSAPLTEKPAATQKLDTKTGRASDAYKQAFWNQLRSKGGMRPELRDALQVGELAEGGYLVPDEFEHTLIQGLTENGIVRAHAHVITTSNGVHKIPVVASHGSASWLDEEGETVRWPGGEHAVVICGYDDTSITYRDPNAGTTVVIDYETFEKSFSELGGRIVYYTNGEK